MKQKFSRALKLSFPILFLSLIACNNSNSKTDKITMEELDRRRTHSDVEQKILDDVEKYGFHISVISQDEYLPGFAYTIGLTKTYNHPEIIIFGLKNEVMSEILNGLGDKIGKGQIYSQDREYSDIVSNFPVKFIEVQKEHYQDYLGYGGWFYNSKFDFSAYQLVWTDKNNKYPWDEGFNDNWKFKQPILDRNTDFKFYEERNLGVFTTQATFDGKPILWVYHNEDGDWQFHSEENPDIENSKIVTIESLVKLDPTLNEIYHLNFGQSAIRKSIESDWEIN